MTHVQFVVLANIAYLNKNDIVAVTLTKEGTRIGTNALPLVEETGIKFFEQNKSEIAKIVV